MKMEMAFIILLVLNAIWFGLGFQLFALRGEAFAKSLIKREHRGSPVFKMFVETGKFMGGFNFTFCLLSILLTIYASTFPDTAQRVLLLVIFGVAHGSQWLSNLPIAMQNKKGRGAWQVKGLMGFIFITDFILMLANFLLALYLFSL